MTNSANVARYSTSIAAGPRVLSPFARRALTAEPPAENVAATADVLPQDDIATLQQQVAELTVSLRSAHAALDAFEHAVLRLDASGGVTFATLSALTLLRAADGLVLSGDKLALTDAQKHMEFQFAFARALAGDTLPHAYSSLLLRRDTDETLQITVLPEPMPPAPRDSTAGVLVFIATPQQPCRSRVHLLRQLYGVSPTESRVADRLAEGLTIREAAAELKLNVETVRFYVKRLLSKTGSRRQIELVRLILRLPNL